MRGARPLVLGVGGILWDCLDESRRPPARPPATVPFHANKLGAPGMVCPRVGTDAEGDELVVYLQQHGLDTACVQRDATHPTGRAHIVRDSPAEQHFEIVPGVAWDELKFDSQLRGVASQADAICFGTLA